MHRDASSGDHGLERWNTLFTHLVSNQQNDQVCVYIPRIHIVHCDDTRSAYPVWGGPILRIHQQRSLQVVMARNARYINVHVVACVWSLMLVLL